MKWVLAKTDERAATLLAEAEGLHPLVARIMASRGIADPAAARSFLACGLDSLSDPSIFQGMASAVDRIRQAVSGREKIVVYGDYDVDGVTGTSLLYLALREMGAESGYYIPDRVSEGYGLNRGALEKINAAGAKLVITVDCGITNRGEAEAARSFGLDLIVTDHHELNGSNDSNGPILPGAYAVLHPSLLRADVPLTTRERVSGLTGVGMAFKLAQALLDVSASDERLVSYLDLVTLGTVADVGALTGENRVLVKHGLDRLSSATENQRPGIAALKEVSGLDGKKIGCGAVGFTLAPRINASGRLERADAAVRLLTTGSRQEALELAKTLDAVNRERQAVEEGITGEAKQLCEQHDLSATGAFVLSSANWHPGVIGIVASRVVEEFYRPTALISMKDGVGKGSARSISGFDLHHGLSQCSDLLLGFGGHKYAAGFSIAEENIPRFRDRLSSLVLESVGPEGFLRSLSIDGSARLDELTIELLRELERLAPFGQGNPEPRIGARGLEVLSSRIVGNKHLKLRLKDANGVALDAIAFKRGHLLGKQVRNGALLAAVFTPRLNAWNGKTSVELDIRDIKSDT